MANSTRLGPKPWRPSVDADLAPGDRLLAVLAAEAEALTAGQLAGRSGLHVNTVRAHLPELAAAGLLTSATVAPSGRGRPAHVFTITPAGRAVPRSGDPAFEEHRGLTSAFATHLASRSNNPSDEARAIGRAWGRELATREQAPQDVPEDAPEFVIRLLARLGFTPEQSSDAQSDAQSGAASGQPAAGADVALRTCPLLELAEEMPEVICQIHLGLVEGALKEHGGSHPLVSDPPTITVELLPFSEPGACRLYLRQTHGE